MVSPVNEAEIAPLCEVRLDSVPAAGGLRVRESGHEFLIVRIGESLRVYDGVCPHLGGPLLEGRLEEGTVRCPWHWFRFDLQTGACLTRSGSLRDVMGRATETPPLFPVRLKSFPFAVKDGKILVYPIIP